MIGADPALAGVMREPALPGAGVQRAHRVGAERAKAHRRDIEDRGRIRLGTIRTADGDAKLLGGTRLRRHRMVHPLVALAIDILLRAERPLVELHLGALIDHGADIAGKRHAVLLALEEILPHLRPDLFQQEAQMRRDRVIAQDRVVLLHEVANAESRQPPEDKHRYQDQIENLAIHDPEAQEQRRGDGANRKDDEAWRERKQQCFHGTSRADSAALFFFGRSLIQLSNQCCTRYLTPRPGM